MHSAQAGIRVPFALAILLLGGLTLPPADAVSDDALLFILSLAAEHTGEYDENGTTPGTVHAWILPTDDAPVGNITARIHLVIERFDGTGVVASLSEIRTWRDLGGPGAYAVERLVEVAWNATRGLYVAKLRVIDAADNSTWDTKATIFQVGDHEELSSGWGRDVVRGDGEFDLDHDGRADLVLRETTGELAAWEILGVTVTRVGDNGSPYR